MLPFTVIYMHALYDYITVFCGRTIYHCECNTLMLQSDRRLTNTQRPACPKRFFYDLFGHIAKFNVKPQSHCHLLFSYDHQSIFYYAHLTVAYIMLSV